jgi:hypothetical protein
VTPMTESEWLICTEPAYMEANVPFSPRKLRLLAVACCRRAAYLVHDNTLRNAIEVAEGFADGGCTEAEFAECETRVQQKVEEFKRRDPGTNCVVMRGDFVRPETYAAEMVGYCLLPDAGSAATHVPFSAASASAGTPYEDDPRFQEEFAGHAGLVRCVYANPFRPVIIRSAWLTPDVTGLARSAYDERIMPAGELDPNASPSSPTPLKRAAATTPTSWATCDCRGRM